MRFDWATSEDILIRGDFSIALLFRCGKTSLSQANKTPAKETNAIEQYRQPHLSARPAQTRSSPDGARSRSPVVVPPLVLRELYRVREGQVKVILICHQAPYKRVEHDGEKGCDNVEHVIL